MGTGCFDLILDNGLMKEAREQSKNDEYMNEEHTNDDENNPG
jgi:hypothetical protein